MENADFDGRDHYLWFSHENKTIWYFCIVDRWDKWLSNISQLISFLKYFVLEKGLLILLLVSIFWVINLQLFNLSCHVDNPCSCLTKMFNQLNLGSKPKSIFFRRGFRHDSFLRWCRNEIKFKPEDSCITQLVSITQNIYNVLCNTWTTYSRG